MSKIDDNPLKLARELGFSILNSTEYKYLKKLEEELMNNELALNLLNDMEAVEIQSDNSIKLKTDNIEIQAMHNSIDGKDAIQKYLEAKENYSKLLKNIYNLIEYISGEAKLSSSNSGCCGKCNSNCMNRKK